MLKVAVLVDLAWTPRAGGHVKCWESLARAAVRRGDVDLSLFVQGDTSRVEHLSERVRFQVTRPILSTERFRFLDPVADHTDLAPIHPRLIRHLWRHELIHTTDAYFSYTRTAEWLARFKRAALVSSVHTDTPGYTRLYADKILSNLCAGWPWLKRYLLDECQVPQVLAERMHRCLQAHAARCQRVLVAERGVSAWRPDLSTGSRTSILRRGVDRELFHPRHRDRARLRREFGIPADRPVLMFAGRVDSGKCVMTLAQAARHLLDASVLVHVVMAGEGREAGAVKDLLGEAVSLPGVVGADTLAWLYASADLFVFPSRIEVAPNVVLEAKASGLAPLVAPEGGGKFVRLSGTDGLIVDSPDPADWAQALHGLCHDPERRRGMGLAARKDIERHHPTWDEVLNEDLIPVWQAALAELRAGITKYDVGPTHTAPDTASG
jgi:glycosyltransferase involved in cell wall biosynthesis